MKKMNNKGYMLAEIILASVIAFGVAYFIVNLTIKLKNKNDDILVETMVVTDQNIITNKLMDYAISEGENFDCSKLSIVGKELKYDNNTIDVLNDFIEVPSQSLIRDENHCRNNSGKIFIDIPLNVPQMADKEYDAKIEYKYEIGDMIAPTCTLTANATKVSFDSKEDDPDGSGLAEYGIVKGTTETYGNNDDINIAIGTFTGFVKDKAGNKASCGLVVSAPSSSTTYTCKKNFDACPPGWSWQTNGCFYYYDEAIGYNTWIACQEIYGGNCTHTEPSYWCPNWHTYYSGTLCYERADYTACSSGESGADGCYQYDQESCTGSWTITSTNTNYDCGSYTKINDSYCYKIK